MCSWAYCSWKIALSSYVLYILMTDLVDTHSAKDQSQKETNVISRYIYSSYSI